MLQAQSDTHADPPFVHFAASFDDAPVAISILDLDLRIVQANRAAQQAYGLTAAELRHAPPLDILSRLEFDRAPPISEVLSTLRTGASLNRSVRFRRSPDAEPVFYDLTLYPIRDAGGQLVQIGSFAIDTSEQVRARDEMKAAQATLRSFVDNCPVPMTIADLSGRHVMLNGIAAGHYGKSEAELLAGDPRDILAIWPEYQTRISACIRDVVATRAARTIETRARSAAAGREIDVMLSVFPILDPAGHVALLGTVGFDITEIRDAQHALNDSKDALHQSEKLAALGQLLAGVAHELNNPLAIVKGRAAILRDKLGDTPHEAAIQKLSDAADRCARIVKTFLAMARQVGPQRGAVDINDVVRGALDMTASGARSATIEVDVSLAEDLPLIETDGDQLVQALINLVVNAHHALEDHDGPRRLRIATRLERDPAKVCIEVADSGPGIPDELAARVFEPFYTSKGVGKGTGLGLSVSKGMVEANGGQLTLTQTPGGGATFLIVLPIVTPAANAAPTPEPIAPQAPRLRALVVDDEADLAEVLAECLETLGFACARAINGLEALEAVAATRFDAIFCDVRMPGMDGAAFYAALKRDRPELLTRLAFVSGDVLHSDFAGLIAEAKRPVIEKPFDMAQIRATAQALVAAGDPP